jgi:hypothetical protein
MMKAKHKKKMKILCQKGGFSPFMFGVLAALSIFSTMLAQWEK